MPFPVKAFFNVFQDTPYNSDATLLHIADFRRFEENGAGEGIWSTYTRNFDEIGHLSIL